MKYLLTAMLMLVFVGIALAAQAAEQEREEIMVVIPLQYMSADVAAQIFGGWVIPPSTWQGYRSARGYGSYAGGSRVGGGYGQSYSGYGNQGLGGRNYQSLGSYGRMVPGDENPEYAF